MYEVEVSHGTVVPHLPARCSAWWVWDDETVLGAVHTVQYSTHVHATPPRPQSPASIRPRLGRPDGALSFCFGPSPIPCPAYLKPPWSDSQAPGFSGTSAIPPLRPPRPSVSPASPRPRRLGLRKTLFSSLAGQLQYSSRVVLSLRTPPARPAAGRPHSICRQITCFHPPPPFRPSALPLPSLVTQDGELRAIRVSLLPRPASPVDRIVRLSNARSWQPALPQRREPVLFGNTKYGLPRQQGQTGLQLVAVAPRRDPRSIADPPPSQWRLLLAWIGLPLLSSSRLERGNTPHYYSTLDDGLCLSTLADPSLPPQTTSSSPLRRRPPPRWSPLPDTHDPTRRQYVRRSTAQMILRRAVLVLSL
jgi:hypothetical protein